MRGFIFGRFSGCSSLPNNGLSRRLLNIIQMLFFYASSANQCPIVQRIYPKFDKPCLKKLKRDWGCPCCSHSSPHVPKTIISNIPKHFSK